MASLFTSKIVVVLKMFPFFFFSHAYVGQDYSMQKNVGKISLEQIDSVSCIDHLFNFTVPVCLEMVSAKGQELDFFSNSGSPEE